MFSRLEPLKYTKRLVDVFTYDSGLESWCDVDELFSETFVRNRVICKFDLIKTFHDLFLPSTIENYRDIVMWLFNRTYDDEDMLSQTIKALMEGDRVFNNKVVNIFYSLRQDESLGNKLLSCLSDRVLEQDSFYRAYFRNKPETFMFISEGYLYFAVADADYVVQLPDKCEVEVISYAKNWNGSIEITGRTA